MKTKWEIIREFCEEQGFEEAANLADEIDTALLELYDDTYTKRHKRDYDTFKYMDYKQMNDFVGTSEYCVACIEHNDVCGECLFGKEHGFCLSRSLFGRFSEAFDAGE